MLTTFNYGRVLFVSIGVLITFLSLLVYSLWAFVYRLSKSGNRTYIFIIITAAFGVINAILYLILTILMENEIAVTIKQVLSIFIPAQWFGMAIIPMTWLSGFSFFSTIIGNTILVKLAYLLTLIIIILIIVNSSIENMAIGSIARLVSWLYFFLFFILVIRHRHQLTRLERAVLNAFGSLNTIRLIFETADIFTLALRMPLIAYVIVMFLFTDFLSAISMALIITFYKKITIKDDLYDN